MKKRLAGAAEGPHGRHAPMRRGKATVDSTPAEHPPDERRSSLGDSYCNGAGKSDLPDIPAVLRALVACGWFGIQTWIGGEAISTLLATLAPEWKNFPYSTAICFLLFWLINLAVILMGIEYIRILQGISAPVLLGVGLLLLGWA